MPEYRQYPESGAIKTWNFGGLTLSLTRSAKGEIWGHVRFPWKPEIATHDTFLPLIPRPQGSISIQHDADGYVYSIYFGEKTQENAWRETEQTTERFAIALLLAPEYAKRYHQHALAMEKAKAEYDAALDNLSKFMVH